MAGKNFQMAKTGKQSKLKIILNNRLTGIILVLIGMIIVLAVASPAFMTSSNWLSILNQASLKGILAIGMTFVIVGSGIDLSVGALMSVCAMFLADILLKGGMQHLWLAILVCLVSGIVCGFINGFLTAYVGLPEFLLTMGTMSIFRGFDYVYTDCQTIRGLDQKWINFWNSGIPWPAIIMIALAAAAYLVIKFTRYGRYVFAVGGNETASRLSGINTKFIKCMNYVLMGLICGICAIVYVGRMSSAEAGAGDGFELTAIAAAAIGGASLSGGRGSIVGAVIGALILSVLSNGLTLLRVSSYYQTIFTGVIIVVAILIDRFSNKD
ncbi:MAG: ABC transporter permease [Eubacterium sp.]|jgi:Ribose/xylose/arabinose/galactoside ABC-type transport systems, permease components|nr:ABC transporter permease [Eubacterium sp.]